MEIIKGNRYVCIEDINGFSKGDLYTVNKNGTHIINEYGSYNTIAHLNYKEYFIPYSKLDKVYTKATPLLNDIFDRYEGLKNGGYMINPIWFDNCDADLNTGWFYASDAFDAYYNENNFTYLSESAFIEFMDLGKYITDKPSTAFNPQKHYDNSNGSQYKVADERGWSVYTFDIVKRLERCGKKDPLRQEIEKSIDVLKIWLNEIE